jgi:Family of unknown function (DUF5677)
MVESSNPAKPMSALPHEAAVAAEIATRYSASVLAMTALLGVVVDMLSVDWEVPTRGLNRTVVFTVIGLLVKACKTFRSIQILIERGLAADANALMRVLMEATVAILYILQKQSRERALIYHAYSMAQSLKMLREWKQTPGLKRKAPKAAIEAAERELAQYQRRLPAGVDVRSHWSGKASLQHAMRALRGDVMYATLFRHTSSASHASDFAAHVEFDPAGNMIFKLAPVADDDVIGRGGVAREVLWIAANRINERFKLGFDAALAPHKVGRQRGEPKRERIRWASSRKRATQS